MVAWWLGERAGRWGPRPAAAHGAPRPAATRAWMAAGLPRWMRYCRAMEYSPAWRRGRRQAVPLASGGERALQKALCTGGTPSDRCGCLPSPAGLTRSRAPKLQLHPQLVGQRAQHVAVTLPLVLRSQAQGPQPRGRHAALPHQRHTRGKLRGQEQAGMI